MTKSEEIVSAAVIKHLAAKIERQKVCINFLACRIPFHDTEESLYVQESVEKILSGKQDKKLGIKKS